jgi:hypothetical protein
MTLSDLREQVPLSYGWRNKAGRVVSDYERDNMTEEERQKFQWRPDPKAVEDLVRAEKAETDRLFEERQ